MAQATTLEQLAERVEGLSEYVLDIAETVGARLRPARSTWAARGTSDPNETLGSWAYDSGSYAIRRRVRYSVPGRAAVRTQVAYRQTKRVGRASARSARNAAKVAKRAGAALVYAPQAIIGLLIGSLIVGLLYYGWVGARKVEWLTGKIVPSSSCGPAAVHPAGFLWFGGHDDGRGTSFTDFAAAMGSWVSSKIHVTPADEANAVAWVVRTTAKTFVVLQHTLAGGSYTPAVPIDTTTAGAGAVPASLPIPSGPGTNGLTLEQTTNAATIVSVGVGIGVPARGQIIGVAVALQESSLINLPGGDGDSVGLFQQRPSWGTLAQRTDPTFAATAFYTRLLGVAGWQAMPLTVAAQAVQVSAFPGAYAHWETLATQLVGQSAGVAPTSTQTVATCAPVATAAGAPGSAVSFALAQIGKPYAWGATGPASYDCSGLVDAAYNLPGRPTTYSLINMGVGVTPGQEQPGDLVFPDAGHVGIELGAGQMVDAPHTGAFVRVEATGPLWAVRRLSGTVTPA